MPFRLQAKNVFLTYPQIGEPISAEDAGIHLSAIAGPDRDYIAVAVALHQDGGHHLHVLLTFKVCNAPYGVMLLSVWPPAASDPLTGVSGQFSTELLLGLAKTRH